MTKKQRLTKECDKLWFKRYLKPLCEVCGSKATQLHHFYPKGLYGHLRYNKDNGISLCMGCHFAHHHKGDPLIHITLLQKRGIKWYQELSWISRKSPASYQTISYYEGVIKQLNG